MIPGVGYGAGIIIQARSGSERFPRKILELLAGKTALWHVIKRCFAAEIPNQRVIVATSGLKTDDDVAREALACGAKVFRGNHKNLLKRYYDAATSFKIDPIIRITADCPFIDPKLIRRIYDTMFPGYNGDRGRDYVCVDAMGSYPDGMDAEIFRYRDLKKEYKYSTNRYNPHYKESKEHVTTAISKNPKLEKAKLFYMGKYIPNMRLTLDYPQDLVVLNVIADALFEKNPVFNFGQIVDFMSGHPQICKLNANLEDLNRDGRTRRGNIKGNSSGRYS